MNNFSDVTNENKKGNYPKWPYIPDHPHKILLIGASRSGKTNVLFKAHITVFVMIIMLI